MNKLKSLNFVYSWIGPLGPLPNHKTPDVYDLTKKSLYTNVEHNSKTDEHDSIVYDLTKHVKCNIIPSIQLIYNRDLPFLFEIVLSPKNNFLQNTLCIGNGFLENIAIEDVVLTLIRHKKGHFLLTSKHESFVEDEDFETIHRYFSYHNIPLNKIIYITNCFNARQKYEEYCLRTNQKPMIKCEYLNLYLLDQSELAKRRTFSSYRPSLSEKQKVFLNLNRRVKSHRILFLLYSMRKNFLEKTHMSFSTLHTTRESWIRDSHSLSNQFNLGFSVKELSKIYNQLPFVLDTDNFDRFPVEDEVFDTVNWYNQTYISVVSETNFDNNIVHMTEKTIKPILFKQPFIVIGPANTLASLKQMGFQTFDKFWDESYDETEDSFERFSKIINTCTEISTWSEKKLQKFFRRSAEITEANFKIMQNLRPTNIYEFLEKYGI
jgi:hypothetical protein